MNSVNLKFSHAVSCRQHDSYREPPVKTARSVLLSAEFWRLSIQRRDFVSMPEQTNENIKYFISSSGNLTHNQSILQSHFVPLPHDWPYINLKLYLIDCGKFKYVILLLIKK